MTIEDTVRLYNDIEPFVWYAVAIIVIPAFRRHAPLRERVVLAALLIAFGTSDFFEAEAWWKPWWLLTWKAAALATIALQARRLWRRANARA